MGTSVFYSSGDDGVAGNGGICLDAARMFLQRVFIYITKFGATDNPVEDGTVFNPDFPVGPKTFLTCKYS